MSGKTIAPIIFHMQSDLVYAHSLQGRIQDFGKGGGVGRGVWVINWQCAHHRCAPLGGLKACPLGTFEILDAFSCNLVHIFFVLSHLSLSFFTYILSMKGGGVRPPRPPPGSAPGLVPYRKSSDYET